MKGAQAEGHSLWQNDEKSRFKQKYSYANQGKSHHRQQDTELYEVCQQLTRENRLLKKQIAELNGAINSTDSEHFIGHHSKQQYRQINYDCYKKKGMQIVSSLKFLYSLYHQKKHIQAKNSLLDGFMAKVKGGKHNKLDELIQVYRTMLITNEVDEEWNIDQLQKSASEYQNSILRRHINKLNNILVQTISDVNSHLLQIKHHQIAQRKDLQQEIKSQCQTFLLNRHQRGKKQKKEKQMSKKNRRQAIENEDQIKKATLSNVRRNQSHSKAVSQMKLDQSFKCSTKGRQLMPITLSNNIRPPIPKPKKINNKHQHTLADQINASKYTESYAITPKSQVKKQCFLKANKSELMLQKKAVQRKGSREKQMCGRKQGKRRNSYCR